MGSGGMIVMDETSCMVDVARFFMEFCMDESCGKCVPCRAGTVQMHGLLDKITRGEATRRDLELLEELCDLVKSTSLCGLGQTAPNPVLSTLRYFRDEYLAPTSTSGGCPAGRLHDLRRRRPAEVHPMSVKTFTIDGKLVSAGEDQTILDVCASRTVPHPDALPPGGPRRRRRLPALPGGGRRARPSCCPPA